MEEKLIEWSAEPQSVYKKLLDWNIFKQVELDTHTKTLFWENLIKMQDNSGNLIGVPLDIDPDTLYDMSTPFAKTNVK